MRHKWLFQLIGGVIFVIILFKVNLKNVFTLLSSASFPLLAVAVALTVVFVVLKALRWQYLLAMQGVDYETKECMLAYLGSMYVGLVTPGRLGDFIKVIYLKTDKGLTFGSGFASVLADRLFDLFMLISMAFSGALALALGRNMLIVILCWILLFGGFLLVVFHERFGKRIVGALFRIFTPKGRDVRLNDQFEDFYSGIEKFKSIRMTIPFLLTILIYLLLYVQCYLIARALHIDITFLNIAFCISAANLVSLLPISISGIGTRDATMIAMFAILGLSKESALSFSIVFLFVSNISACVIGAIAWFRKPLNVKV
jgi:glycosyltransferase 2 family protein